jgi:hypothetical protein
MRDPLKRHPIARQEFVSLFSDLVINPEKLATDCLLHFTTREMRQTMAHEGIQACFRAVIGNAPGSSYRG